MNSLKFLLVAAIVAAACLQTGNLHAQLEVSGYSIDSGGGMLVGGSFTVESSIGQPDAGPELSGGSFVVIGGFQTEASVILGDVNGDGEVNLLDVAPFIDAISDGEFIAAADVNQDGQVNLLDVEPFVQLLSG